jgi:D-alanyl-D-alanine carboxypeptidase/D-alanyl-D-alanine-endopeptidase (penicillin-binding protein 4)
VVPEHEGRPQLGQAHGHDHGLPLIRRAAVAGVRYTGTMTRAGTALGALLAVVALVGATASSTGAASPDLAPALARALRAPGVDARRTAALAVDLRTGEVVFRSNETLALAPASAEKLAVSFAALRALGAGYRFRTEVAGSGELVGRTWRGDLFLVGGGDPTLARGDLEALARDVVSWGIRRVEGAVVGDETHFDARRDAPGWKPRFLGVESRALSALSVDGASARGANGSAAAAAAAFRRELQRHGVSVAERAGTGRAPEDGVPLALDLSAPLASIVRHMNRESDNFVAELLLKELGAVVAGRGTTAAGAGVVLAELRIAGVAVAGVRISDGSGLSRLDRLTAQALVGTLLAGTSDPAVRGAFVDSLSVAGISGTLKRRLVLRPTRSRVIAKTGTTSQASALAGFVRRRYVFAIVQNGSPVPYWSARAAQDRFVTVLARS